jgi:hypothetical protein
MILGTPFLTQFSLSISVSCQSLLCDKSGLALFDYCLPPHRKCNETHIASLSNAESAPEFPCKDSEQRVLHDYQDLFPLDIPAVSDKAEAAGLFTDGTFP